MFCSCDAKWIALCAASAAHKPAKPEPAIIIRLLVGYPFDRFFGQHVPAHHKI